jgi:serine-aspartate repeat-containing protein C/D/E
VGLISHISRSWKKSREAKARTSTQHVCRFEQLEPRIALSATPGPELDVGATYYEQSSPESAGDRFEIAWVGGAANTQLTTLTISGDQDDNGFDDGDVFFDIDSLPPGASSFAPFLVISPDSDITAAQITSWTVTNGGTDLILTITGWDAGKKLVFTIDVDERDDVTNSQVEGAEFERATFTATFVTTDGSYQSITKGGRVDGEFTDAYTLLPSLGSLLPADTGTDENDPRAGTSFSLHQTPNPIQISGRVHHDVDLDGDCDDPDPPVTDGSGAPIPVTLELWIKEGSTYVDTGERAVTDADGNFSFTYESAGTFQIREQQPTGYFSTTPNIISEITVNPGQHSTDHCFGEALPGSLSGHVYEDDNDDGTIDIGEGGIGGVTVTLRDSGGNLIGTTTTNAGGFYQFTNLDPTLTYTITETQPGSYLDGQDTLGSLGGNASVNDRFSLVSFTQSGQSGTDYDFGEIEPASLSGYVYQDLNDNDLRNGGEPGIGGVTLELLDGSGNPVLDSGGNPITTTTNGSGFYQFNNLDPRLTYGVQEVQPAGYFDGQDQVGSAGGIEQNDKITSISGLQPGVEAVNYNFGELPAASISGFVFQDGPPIVLPNGVHPSTIDPMNYCNGRTPDDTPIAGVLLRLADADGNFLLDGSGHFIETVTDANGFYQFTGLHPGTYTVFEFQPAGYIDGLESPGTAGGVVSHPGDSIARITVGPGMHSEDNNFCELAVVTLPPPPPPPPPPITPPTTPETIIQTQPTQMGPGPGLAPPLPPPGGPATNIVFFGGGAPPQTPGPGSTFHLSVIDAGRPRGEFQTAGFSAEAEMRAASTNLNVFSTDHAQLSEAHWVFASSPQAPANVQYIFGSPDGIPVTGDFDGDGKTEVGIYRRGEWFIDVNGNGIWDEGDLWAKLGTEADLPVTGDWDGDGKTDIGIHGPEWPSDPRAVMLEPGLPDRANESLQGAKQNVPPPLDEAQPEKRQLQFTALGRRREDVIDHTFYYGTSGDIPVAGDWNGDGVWCIGVFNNGVWILDENGDGRGDATVTFGQAGDIPIVGDWTGDGVDKLGVYRQGTWILDTNNNRRIDEADRTERLGGSSDKPVVGDWNGDGTDEIGLYRRGGQVERGDGT